MRTPFRILAACLLLPSSSQALYFSIWPIAAYDRYGPVEQHNITFAVSNPAAVYEQGGSYPSDCNIGWEDCDPPTCWQHCEGDTGYYTRITAGTYKGANDFSLDIWQEYVYELANHNNATIHIVEDSGNYTCDVSDDIKDCSTRTAARFNQTLHAYYGGATPDGGPVCS